VEAEAGGRNTTPWILSPRPIESSFLRLRRQTSVEVRLVKRPRLDPEFWATGKQLRKEDQFTAQVLINAEIGKVESTKGTLPATRTYQELDHISFFNWSRVFIWQSPVLLLQRNLKVAVRRH
jgi:hypothetical protein